MPQLYVCDSTGLLCFACAIVDYDAVNSLSKARLKHLVTVNKKKLMECY